MAETLRYRLSTTSDIPVATLLERLSTHIVKESAGLLECIDGSRLIIKRASSEGLAMVELQACLDVALRDQPLVIDFVALCQEEGVKVRSVRNGQELAASMGAVHSDMRGSKAFRDALHRHSHPKDRKPR